MNVAGAKSLRKIKRLKKMKLECDDIEIVIKKKVLMSTECNWKKDRRGLNVSAKIGTGWSKI